MNYQMDYTKETRCLVRNFFIYKDPQWAAKIELNNGKKIFFSSPKSLIEFYHRPGKWFDIGVKNEKDFKDIIVTDYVTMKLINAKDAFYIYGSRAISPSGDDLVAIENEQDAKNFAKKYNGKRVFKFNEVSDALIRLINGRI
ncbi:MAG: nitrous oxide reductase accessory protein NosL [Arcobacteraceae bacterium]|nr:nitrous oxide reductase accessory protein NosL [Arcobacteraceae bacterium]